MLQSAGEIFDRLGLQALAIARRQVERAEVLIEAPRELAKDGDKRGARSQGIDQSLAPRAVIGQAVPVIIVAQLGEHLVPCLAFEAARIDGIVAFEQAGDNRGIRKPQGFQKTVPVGVVACEIGPGEPVCFLGAREMGGG